MNYTLRGRRRPGINAAVSAAAPAALLLALAPVPIACAQSPTTSSSSSAPTAAASRNLLEAKQITMTPSSAQVSVSPVTATGVTVTITPGADAYPGVQIKPQGATSWDLSGFGHVEARVVNTSAKPLSLSLRVDNAGDWRDNPWNTETITLAPGASGTVTTIFGYAYGKKRGYALDPKKVVNLLLFTTKSDSPQSFRVETLAAAGPAKEQPPVDPNSVRVRPAGGALLGGTGVQVTGERGAQVSPAPSREKTAGAVQVTLPASGVMSVRPTTGRWDLRDCLEVRVQVRNTGKTPVTPHVRVDSNGGPRENTSATPLAAGATATITVPFIPSVVPDLSKKETTGRFTSDAVSGVTLSSAEPGTLVVEAITADMPAAPKLPDWLGKRPPVPGEWTQTLAEEFDGTTLNTRVWDPEGENYYDKTTHWSKNNVLIGGGVARLRYEKKTGFQNDDPTKKKTDYAAGYLNTYGRWTQRYGYFEARMKLPSSPGLWPAFWMMPDRGAGQGNRQDTGNGGMEFDILESLTRWGPTRYNIAMHYDGYGKDHKSLGSDAIYVQPDKDGYLTAGLLWTPGLAVYYCNGREVLRWENPRISNVPSAIMFTLPSGGWDNDALDDTRLPADLVIDYVRVWQRKDLAAGGK